MLHGMTHYRLWDECPSASTCDSSILSLLRCWLQCIPLRYTLTFPLRLNYQTGLLLLCPHSAVHHLRTSDIHYSGWPGPNSHLEPHLHSPHHPLSPPMNLQNVAMDSHSWSLSLLLPAHCPLASFQTFKFPRRGPGPASFPTTLLCQHPKIIFNMSVFLTGCPLMISTQLSRSLWALRLAHSRCPEPHTDLQCPHPHWLLEEPQHD